MQAPSSKRTIGCIGKCTTGLGNEELDRITDNIHRTLNHPRGVDIFKRYLERQNLSDNLDCLHLYLTCTECIEREKTSTHSQDSLETLADDVKRVKELAEDLDGVPSIDMALMERFNEVLTSDSRLALIAVLEDTRDRMRDHLRLIHGRFKQYASQPCPLTK